ncbi:3-hydroxyacyl-ACP dehydratase FabZ family protein [Kitasatospora sp. NPDC056181]|uniref:3-hydroxyacyl-ACP dehydratase FabZ family protein n=1 Tax=Kitasatospora sp. NPDC056181 TaxID=3345737 RepID=UPI0035E3B4D0
MTTARTRAVPIDPVDWVSVRSDSQVRAGRTVRADDPYLVGHYPDLTVYPGVFLIETVYEAVARLVRRTHGPGTAAEPAVLRSVRFTTALRPGDPLEVDCECTPGDRPDRLVAKAVCTTGQARAAQMTIEFRLVDTAAEGGPDA